MNSFVRFVIVFIALSGAFSVLFGAWLVHAGQTQLEVVKMRLESAHHYQVIHTLALLAVYVLHQLRGSRATLVSMACFVVGILMFSGSLYIKTYTGVESIGKLAPIGGSVLAIGWLALAFIGSEKK